MSGLICAVIFIICGAALVVGWWRTWIERPSMFAAVCTGLSVALMVFSMLGLAYEVSALK